jgi:hypothetical protein
MPCVSGRRMIVDPYYIPVLRSPQNWFTKKLICPQHTGSPVPSVREVHQKVLDIKMPAVQLLSRVPHPTMFPVILLAILATTALWLRRRNQKYPLPPGPPADPLIGHLRLLSAGNTAENFNEWAQKYGASRAAFHCEYELTLVETGDVMNLWIPGRQIIVLNSDEAANDLLNKQSSIFSSRPSMPIYEMCVLLDVYAIH